MMQKKIELPIAGMDCAECTEHVRHALAALPGVDSVEVFLATEKAILALDPARVTNEALRQAVEQAGYSVREETPPGQAPVAAPELAPATRRIATLLLLVFGAVLLVVVLGEWLGLLDQVTDRVPFPLGAALVLAFGWPIWVNVVRAARRRQVISHTLMTLGVIAALAVGQWATAAVVVLFMHVGDYVENMTTGRARQAVRDLTARLPQMARVERDGAQVEVPISQVRVGDIVVVRPGDQVPVDGEVMQGGATINQSTITGEAMPVEVGPGDKVFAATFAQLGSLRIRTESVGRETQFGRVVQLVEEAEANRAHVQRFADRFSGYYLPVVVVWALVTFLLRRDPLATAAVLLVACSCSITLATPIAMLASIGAAARRGILIKGGKYLEALAGARVLLIDKTGTLTLGRPQVTDVVALNGLSSDELLTLAASAERDSEHPAAHALRAAALDHLLSAPAQFEAVPGQGIRALVNAHRVEVGSRRLVERGRADAETRQDELEAQGKTVLRVAVDGELAGLVALSDTPRAEVAQALAELRGMGLERIEILTGDNERAAGALASSLGIPFRANLLPQDKINIVREYQARGLGVVMVGDGVNDAPALAQADVGIAMGALGSDIAIQAAHIALLREDWRLVPEVLNIARRTMGVVRMNLGFTGLYNLAGLTLAALGFLPPVLAAAAQSLPDLGILANSARLLRSNKTGNV